MRLPTRGSLDRTADPDANLPIGKLPTTIYDYFNPRQVTGVTVPSPHKTALPPGGFLQGFCHFAALVFLIKKTQKYMWHFIAWSACVIVTKRVLN